MAGPLTQRFTLSDLRAARSAGRKIAMLTCYDYSTARIYQEAGVPMLLVGDSIANVILGHQTTLPVSLSFMIEITAAVRRGAPKALVMADMPFGSYSSDISLSLRTVSRMMKLSGCDCVKMEVTASHADLVRQLTDIGVPVVAHLGLKPQSVNVMGGYRAQGRTAADASAIIELTGVMERAGAAALLIEAVPPEVSQRVVDRVSIPVIGCGAGPACDAFVVVGNDALGYSAKPPKFVPRLSDVAGLILNSAKTYVEQIVQRQYPAPEHNYEMAADQRDQFLKH